MKLLLIRHAETEHNVQGLLAGVTDSALTNHGVLQTHKLGQHLATNGFNIAKIYTSDLKRARMTAEAIREHQKRPSLEDNCKQTECIESALLREQDFGSKELEHWNSKRRGQDESAQKSISNGFRDKESLESMVLRADSFLDEYLGPVLGQNSSIQQNIAIVSHGLFLSALWKRFLLRFGPLSVNIAPTAASSMTMRPLEHLPSWSNTGYLELEILPRASAANKTTSLVPIVQTDNAQKVYPQTMAILKVNSTDHLKSLKRTRGGVGSSAYDIRQQKLDGFFGKKQKVGE
ncbi:MAG: hypothetical protein Q9227_001039 [Pyrenula ochraceoflavens]